ncbi:FHA domain-containing protein, partial [Desulfofundulus sp.]|uniref:FHA domain-containing protein n=1 Tax=Desulfofundulus sp. TaxID=2282750 RepID=UPI003C712EDD
TIFRYLFLFLFYAFLIVVVREMFWGMRANSPMANPVPPGGTPGTCLGGLPSRNREARLVVLASSYPGLEKGMTFYLGERITLGRGEHNDLVVPDPFSSQEHAVIFLRGDQYWVQDLASLNGTYLNEVRLDRPAVLADGDRLRIGSVTFQFVRWGYEVESSQ